MKKELIIGFIGLGNMGYYMAKNIAKNGYSMVVYDIRTEVVDEFINEKIEKAYNPKDVADLADVVLVSLPTPEIVKRVAIGKGGLVEGKRIQTYIDLSTSGQTVSNEVGKVLLGHDINVLDSPVSGGVPGAEKATLSLMVAGAEKAFTEHYELLSCLGRKVIHVGDEIGQAQVMKVINNLLSSSALAITSEALVLGVKAGLNPEKMIDVLNVSSGRNSATEDKFKKSIINRKFDYGFKTDLAYKDMKLCLDLAENLKVPMYLGTNITHFWRYIMTQGAEGEDYTTIVKYFEQWANVEVGQSESEPSKT
ncbi:NAD(P)-dependent oxidoreductase [Evansella halocellulosilytica]|uniref:NAD(P)-dependent oxidoreductase n=1 Tax=Evansella halocellulosilytica TaxID=2011013 RepID=UPI000BB7BE3F|nr:NAD(P)-dependent oxidoreductase [Evansella halocellulosilytica]